MPSSLYRPGDICWCTATVCNAEAQALEGNPLWVILDVFGTYYFAPSFSQTPENYLAQYPRFEVGETVVEVLPSFTWPEGAGSANGVVWYGALTDPQVTTLVGELGSFTFGWEE